MDIYGGQLGEADGMEENDFMVSNHILQRISPGPGLVFGCI